MASGGSGCCWASVDQAQFQHGLGQLLEEQRHAVGPRDDLVADLGRQRPSAAQTLDHGSALTAAQPVELQQRGVRLGAPGRREVRPEGHHDQRADLLGALDHQIEELERRGIDPLRILEDGQDRPLARQRLDLLDQHLEEPLLLPLRAERERRIARLVRQRQERCDQRHDLGRIAGRASSASSLSSCCSGGSLRSSLATRRRQVITGCRALF